MRIILFLSLLFCTALSCTTRINISQTRIHKNSKFDGSFAITKILVDSFDKAGKPLKFKEDSTFYCARIWDLDYEELPAFLSGKSKNEYLNLLHFRDSLNLFGKQEIRDIDTITLYGKRYIPGGLKKPLAFYETEAKLDAIKFTQIKARYRKTIRFSDTNKHYRWYAWKDNGRGKKKKLSQLIFMPGAWYYLPLDCSFGLLSSGHCDVYFSFDEKGRQTLYRDDKVNEGPF